MKAPTIAEMVEAVEREDEGALITVCQGPPRCALHGDEAVAAARAGCVWCDRIYIGPGGSEHREGPGNA